MKKLVERDRGERSLAAAANRVLANHSAFYETHSHGPAHWGTQCFCTYIHSGADGRMGFILLEGVRVDGHCRNEETHQQLNNNKSSTTLGECYEMCHELTAKILFVEGIMVSCFSSILQVDTCISVPVREVKVINN